MKSTQIRVGVWLCLATGAACGGVRGPAGGASDANVPEVGTSPSHDAATACVPEHTISCACIGGSTGVQVCNPAGTAYGVCACSGGEAGTLDAGCVSGTLACLGATPETCVATQWVLWAACEGAEPICLHGACVECAPGATRCSAGTAEICDVAGGWQPQAACSCTETFCGGACIDSQSDPHNCGGCAHDCYGGTCLAGACQPVTLATEQISPFAIAVDPSFVYWTSSAASGAVVKMALDGGAFTTLASEQNYPGHIAVDTKNVYWANGVRGEADAGMGPNGTVVALNLVSGTITTLATGLYSPDTIVAMNGLVAWDDWGNWESASNAGSVVVDTVGGTPMTLATGQYVPTGLALSATALYWCNQEDTNPGDGVVFSLARPLGSTPPATLSSVPPSGMSSPMYVAIDTKNIYWTDFTSGTVMATPLAGGAETTLATGIAPYGIATDGVSVYWSDWGAGDIVRVTIDGGATTTLVSGQDNPLTIALDSTRVYWASYNRGTVLSVAK